METKYLAWAVMGLVGCAQAGDPANGNHPACVGSKCDGDGRDELTAFEYKDLVRCAGTKDSTEDLLFASDSLECSFEAPADAPAKILAIYVTATFADDDQSTIQFGDGEDAVQTLRWGAKDAYPIELAAAGIYSFADRTYAFEQRAVIAGRDELAAWTASAPFALNAPFEVQPIAFWPSAELQEASATGAVSGPFITVSATAPLATEEISAFGGMEATKTVESSFSVRGETLEELAEVHYVLAPAGGFSEGAASAETRLRSAEGEVVKTGELSGAGYYVIALDGSFVRTAAAELPAFSLPDVKTEENPDPSEETPTPCGGSCAENEECIADACTPIMTTPVPTVVSSVCDPGCQSWQICVPASADGGAGRCVSRNDQYSSTSLCDAADGNDDCASGFACIDATTEAASTGYCRRVSDQYQSMSVCDVADGNAECADGFVCVDAANESEVGGYCRRVSDQYQSTSVCDAADGDAECASGFVCVDAANESEVGGYCRRLSDQYQSNSVCDVAEGNGECASGFVCVDAANESEVGGYCRRKSDQYSGASICDFADGDGDCASGYSCSRENRCVRI